MRNPMDVIPHTTTESGSGFVISNCPCCGSNVDISSTPTEKVMLYQVRCLAPWPQCNAAGPYSLVPSEAAEGWQNLIGRYSDGSTKHL